MPVVFVLLAILVIVGTVMALTGRWDVQMKGTGRAPAPELPPGPWNAGDISNLKFRTGLRGYRMSDVDAALAALAAQLETPGGAAAAAAPAPTAAASATADDSSAGPATPPAG